ncbi:hypothetical protein GLYMA_03G015132v4 [Glycine max]|nr:hypothetical protein GLYMA_03G015132v4 [Glycine max]KAH1068183.1 hypothetical protein GYH30_005945 [Glycine max]
MSKVKILVVGGTCYLGQHLLQVYAHANANANANISGTPFVFDLAFTHHSSPPPHPLLDAIPSSLPFQVDLKTGLGFEAISNTFGQGSLMWSSIVLPSRFLVLVKSILPLHMLLTCHHLL